MKQLYDINSKAKGDPILSKFRFGISFNNDNQTAFFADDGVNTVSAATSMELLKVLSAK